MSALWEWVPDLNWSHDITRRYCVPPDATTYGAVIDQDLRPPTVIKTFRGRGITANELALILAALAARGDDYTLTDKFADSHTGTVLSVTSPTINGALNPTGSGGLFEVVITMRMP